MALTSSRPYTRPVGSPLETLARRRSPTAVAQTYRPPVGDQGNPNQPAYPWYKPVQTPGPTTIDTTPGGAGGNGGGGGTTTAAAGYENDPAYQQIKALAEQSVAQAEAGATASQKQLAIQLGDPGLANSLGLGSDTAYAAQNNPYSTLANLLRGHVAGVQGINASTNDANTFFSSTRGKELGQEQTGYGNQRYNAANAAQSALAQIAANLLAAKQNAAMQEANAAGDWYQNHKDDPADPHDVQYQALQNLLNGTYTAADVKALSPTTVLRILSG